MTDNDTTLTRCPHCQTRFRVTPGQLAAAHGKVRCGHCMKVFNALDYAEASEPPPEDSSSEPVSEETAQPEAEETTEEAPAAEEHAQQEKTPDTDEDDELIFDDNPEEDAQEKGYSGTKADSDYEYDETFLAIEKGETPTFYDTFDEDEDQPLVDDESWAESLLEEEGVSDERPAPQDDWELPDPDPLEHELEFDDRDSRQKTRATSSEKPATEQNDATSEPAAAASREAPDKEPDIWQDLRSQPVAAPASDRRRLSKALWPVLATALVALLVYQVGWVHQDRLAQVPELRPWYESWCDLTGCELRPLQDVERIESRQLIVRSHPDQDNALLVEATLVNRAGFSQPFPAIALSFSNLNNDIVAQRVFQPREYLGGDARDLESMPPATPFRVSLSLQDPGRDAISYRIDFLPSS